MNSNKNEAHSLSDGWVSCNSKSSPGRTYYFNMKTGKSSWTRPQVAKNPEEKKINKTHKAKEKHKREEIICKTSKRKSDGSNEGTSHKKHKQVIISPPKPMVTPPTPEKHGTYTRTKPIPHKRNPEKRGVTKNIANFRLAKFRAKLNTEVQEEAVNTEKSSVKHKISPHTETQSKKNKGELKSPVTGEPKCSSSPSNDSLQSAPSPTSSQFFAANKIISSMKAHLPEEYSSKLKPKDTYADIEQGICNQNSDYSSMKHPATPPQFSEASKLVSAIKSKLTYKTGETVTYASAKDRMEAFRSRINGNLVENTQNIVNIRENALKMEPMEVEELREMNQLATTARVNAGSKKNVVLVVDTNIFIHNLDEIKNVINSHIKGYSEQPTLLVPWRVINELDRLKDNNNGNGALCKRARSAMSFLYKSLPEDKRIKGQSLRDSNSHIYPCELPDDEILNCCLQQVDRGKSVILLSNDRNLCNKALINGVKCIDMYELKDMLENKPQENVDPDLHTSVKQYQYAMYQLLANILENEMRAKYNNLWQHVLFKPPPWTLADVLQCLLKHWIAVFSDVFPRIQHLLTELRNTITSIGSKNPQALFQSEVNNFKELCLDIAKKCQIIPEYMDLAKLTVERLLRKGCEREGKPEGEGDAVVIDAFERLWTVFSSYCAKLSSALGVEHSIEDKLPGSDPIEALTSKLTMFSNHINALTNAMKGASSLENLVDSNTEDRLTYLEHAFRDSLTLICNDCSIVNKNNLRQFCSTRRNLLEEASGKFLQLTKLLEICKSNLATNVSH